MTALESLWHAHRDAAWPKFSDPNEGALMTLDTVVSGCVTYYLDSEDGLDPQRVSMLASCLTDLDALLPGVADEAREYFQRVRSLAHLLLDTHEI